MAFGKVRGSLPKARQGNGGNSGQYAPVEPGYYVAVALRADEGKFNAKFKGQKGTFDYLKFTPEILLLNEAQTIINRQDIVIGVVDGDGYLYRPDGNETKSPLFSDARFFLEAVGFVNENEEVAYDTFSPELITGQVLRVRVDNETYTDKEGNDRQKNIITGFYPVREADVEAFELHVDEETGMVFRDADSVALFNETYEALLEDAETEGL